MALTGDSVEYHGAGSPTPPLEQVGMSAPGRLSRAPARQGHAGPRGALGVDQAGEPALHALVAAGGLRLHGRARSAGGRRADEPLGAPRAARARHLQLARPRRRRVAPRAAGHRGARRDGDIRRVLHGDDPLEPDGGAPAAAGAVGEARRLRRHHLRADAGGLVHLLLRRAGGGDPAPLNSTRSATPTPCGWCSGPRCSSPRSR